MAHGMTEYDAIVIGSGSAGLFAAIELQRHKRILVATKAGLKDANTNWAQGGIAAAVGKLDTPERHFQDTVAAGAGLVDEEAAAVLCREGPELVAELARCGVDFDVTLGGRVDLALEAAHSTPRVLHAGGDRTGAAIEAALAGESQRVGIEILTDTLVTRILLQGGRVEGVEVLNDGTLSEIAAKNVIIATGGAGQLFSFTTNPEVATGDGIALAFEAGARVANLEFFQFHPTALRLEGMRPFLISEALRGEGAILRNADGEAFMKRYHPEAELAPRDIVSRAIASEMSAAASDHVYLDCSHITEINLPVRFPTISSFCLEAGIDIRERAIPVAPAAHYFMGGVQTDVWGRTNVPGLYSCGESASTGLHGANRLASNSLIETVVFARRVAQSIVAGDGDAGDDPGVAISITRPEGCLPRADLQSLLWTHGSITRNGAGLKRVIQDLDAAPAAPPNAHTKSEYEDRSLSLVARLMLEAALRRTESRGAHFRSDHPDRDDGRWQRQMVLAKECNV